MKWDHVLLTPENFKSYLVSRRLVNHARECVVRELGGGVSNIVLLIEWPHHPGRRWVAKQSLEKLRVKDDWRSDRGRIFREAEAIRSLGPALGDSSLPELVHVDQENFLFIMTAAPAGSVVWKDQLLAGHIELNSARQAGAILAGIMTAGRADPSLREKFEDRTVFDQLRIDPYYRTTTARHQQEPGLQAALRNLIADSFKIRTSLVHGDFSPKNILVQDKNIFLIDFEVVHWGDPSFDAGFLLNHLFLKAFHKPQFAPLYLGAAREFWKALVEGIGPEGSTDFELMTIRHLGGLMLARIDGKSPVEYIREDETKERLRNVAKSILLQPPMSVASLVDWISEKL
jgi:5-methylthioribose kinase